MSITLTIVTTANRSRRFKQSDPARITEILESLKRCAQLFSNRSLIVVSDTSTAIYSPSAITRIEIETGIDLTPYLPPARNTNIRALALGDPLPPTILNEQVVSVSADFFFAGGDTLSTWIENERPTDALERTMRITRLFEQPVIFYQPTAPGIGLINPAVMTSCTLGAALPDAPTGSWHLSDTL
ncbi:MAG: hypothetical protein PHV02_15045 [Rhodocyclaceae bacterium]|nr:hypothetical protein [Rhodocyclaceae bacterium]